MPKSKGAIMNKLETNALRIIELLYPDIDINGIEKYKDFFSSYQGLMPIIFEIYASKHFTINIYNWVGRCILLAHNSNTNPNWGHEILDCNYKYDFNRDITEPEFIEALQLVCIKYLELK